MKSKALVYTVLAVALGYFLISAVPNQMETLQGVRQLRGSVESESLSVEAPESTGSKSPSALDESVSVLRDSVTVEEFEIEKAPLGGVREGAVTVGLWMTNLMIALAVYFLVKRRLS